MVSGAITAVVAVAVMVVVTVEVAAVAAAVVMVVAARSLAPLQSSEWSYQFVRTSMR